MKKKHRKMLKKHPLFGFRKGAKAGDTVHVPSPGRLWFTSGTDAERSSPALRKVAESGTLPTDEGKDSHNAPVETQNALRTIDDVLCESVGRAKDLRDALTPMLCPQESGERANVDLVRLTIDPHTDMAAYHSDQRIALSKLADAACQLDCILRDLLARLEV